MADGPVGARARWHGWQLSRLLSNVKGVL